MKTFMKSPGLLLLSVAMMLVGTAALAQNVGVDIASPLQKLDVAGGLRIGNTTNGLAGSIRWTGTQFEGHDGTTWIPLGSATDTDWIISGINQYSGVAGNVGIGTTTPADKLDVFGTIKATNPGTSPNGSSIKLSSPANDIGVTMDRGNGSGSSQQRWDMKITSDNALRFRSQNTTDYFSFTNAGNLGIGTTTPTEKLSVWNGDFIIGGNQNIVDRGMTIYGARQGTTNTAWNLTQQGHAFIKFDNYDGNNSATQYTSAVITSTNVPGSDDGDLRFFTTSDMVPSEAMRIDHLGNVGIGATPAEKLHVAGKIRMVDGNQAAGRVLVSDANGTGTWTAATSLSITETDPQVSSSTTNRIPKWNGTALVDGVGYDDGTNIGIGTTTPLQKLHVNTGDALFTGASGTASGIEIVPRNASSNGGGRIYFREDNNDLFGISIGYNGGNSGNEILNWPANTFNISTHSNDATGGIALTILRSGGNVGINTTNPAQKLDVNGKIQMQTGAVVGYVPVSDANGTMTWTNPATLTTADDGDWMISGTNQYSAVSGNVGIGTSAPLQKLHINTGDALFTGASGTASGIELIPRNATSNGGGRMYFREDNNELFGISMGYNGGNTGNEILNWPANTFNISTHNNDATGGIALTILRSGGNVGINTTTPAQKLDVNGKIQMQTGATAGYVPVSDANGTMTWTNPNSLALTGLHDADNDTKVQVEESADEDKIRFDTFGSERMIIDNTGNVGIGITIPTEKLSVWNGDFIIGGNQNIVDRGMTIYGARQGTTNTTWNVATQGHAFIKFDNFDGNNAATQYTSAIVTSFNVPGSDDGDLRFFTTSDMVPSEAMRIDHLGNVGVGATPAEKLHVAGKIRMVDGNQAAGRVLVSDVNGTGTWTAASSLAITETDPQVSSATTNLIPKWNGTTLVDGIVFDNGTNIGIGTTTPAAKLDIVGTLNGSGGATFGNNVVVTGDYYLTNTSGTGTNNPNFRIDGFADKMYVIAESSGTGPATGTEIRFRTASTNAAASDRMTINNNGNVGVGTSNPTELLHVQRNSSDAIIKVESPGSSYEARIMFQKNGANTANVGFYPGTAELRLRTGQATGILFEPNGVERMRVHSDGNVGIGTSLPVDELHIVGSIRMVDGNQAAGKVMVSDVNG
ncbi:MAG: hypothetical protein K9J06_15435, partial [Flavobacteriales bacterium]|nr:hypothetical protein [Flavobacteriales bacterium]